MNPSEDQELEYVPIDEEASITQLVIRLTAIIEPPVLDILSLRRYDMLVTFWNLPWVG